MPKKDKEFDAKHRFAPGNDVGGKTQFKPGQSGNPKGPPKAKTRLWMYFCQYLGMTDSQFDKLKSKKKLKQVQQAAIKMVEDFVAGFASSNIKLAVYTVDRDEGKALETIRVSSADPLTDEECENIRDILINNAD